MSLSDQNHLISDQVDKISEAGKQAIESLYKTFQAYSSKTPYAGVMLSLDGQRIIYLSK